MNVPGECDLALSPDVSFTPKPVPTTIEMHMKCVLDASAGGLEQRYLQQSLKLARIYQVESTPLHVLFWSELG